MCIRDSVKGMGSFDGVADAPALKQRIRQLELRLEAAEGREHGLHNRCDVTADKLARLTQIQADALDVQNERLTRLIGDVAPLFTTIRDVEEFVALERQKHLATEVPAFRDDATDPDPDDLDGRDDDSEDDGAGGGGEHAPGGGGGEHAQIVEHLAHLGSHAPAAHAHTGGVYNTESFQLLSLIHI